MKSSLIKYLFVSFLFINLAFAENKNSIEGAAPKFELAGLNADMIQLSNYRGKVVYLDFWATWCVPCRKSFPWMNELLEKYQSQGLEIIAVSLDEKQKMVENFLKRYSANFTIALDPTGESADLYKVRGMPSSYIIDRSGNIVKTHMGFRAKDKARLEELIQATLASSK